MLFAAQQLLGDARAWWANFTATRPANQVQWVEFREAFCVQHIPAGIMKSKYREFMDLKQGDRSMYAYSKLFNHLTQYAPEQVDADEKKYCFMNGLSTKLLEGLALNVDGTFLELVSNAIITDDAIRDHWESKKKKALVAPSVSAPSKYRIVCPTSQPTPAASSSPKAPFGSAPFKYWIVCPTSQPTPAASSSVGCLSTTASERRA
jgi:hypothetical protein